MLEIEYVATDDLIPYFNNSRTHSESQVKQIAASIREFGFTNPILIDEEQTIIAGHGRVMAAEVLSMSTVPCIRLSGLSEAQRKAYVIADNNLALNSGWNIELLRVEIEELERLDFDIPLLGFDDDFMQLIESPEIELGMTPEEKLENYLQGDTKILRLAYSQEELESVVALLDKGLEATGSEDYSTLVFGLLRECASRW